MGLSEAMRTAEAGPYGWFIRTAAVLVGLANLVVLVDLFGGSPVARGTVWGTVSLYEALPRRRCSRAPDLGGRPEGVRAPDRLG